MKRERRPKMTRHIGFVHGSKLEPFSPPSFCRSGAGLQQYTYYYQQGYRRVTGKPYYYDTPKQKLLRIAA
jgi:hypothetical protein